MSVRRRLTVNADDFGLSPGVNRGIVAAHERGIVTAASLMVRWPAAAEAATYARQTPGLSLGLHVDLCDWIYRDGAWVELYRVVPTDDATAVAGEIARQIERFRDLVGRNPTHLDSHQHVHRDEPVRSVLVDVATRLSVPLRHFSPLVRHCGKFYGQSGRGDPYPEGITSSALIDILAALEPGWTEVGCHPGYADDVTSPYRAERAQEVATLCDPAVRTALADLQIDLCPFPTP